MSDRERRDGVIDFLYGKLLYGAAPVSDVKQDGDRLSFTLYPGQPDYELRCVVICVEARKP